MLKQFLTTALAAANRYDGDSGHKRAYNYVRKCKDAGKEVVQVWSGVLILCVQVGTLQLVDRCRPACVGTGHPCVGRPETHPSLARWRCTVRPEDLHVSWALLSGVSLDT